MYHIHEDKRVAQSVEQICQGLRRLLEERPFAEISVTALVAQAGVSKATFYRSFDSLEDVLRLQADGVVAQMIAYISQVHRERAQSGEMGFFQAFFRFWMAHDEVVLQLMQTKTTYLLIDAFGESLARHTDMLRRFAVMDERAMGYFIVTRAASLTAVLCRWMAEQPRTHPDEMPHLLRQVLGPAVPPGHTHHPFP